MESQCELDFLVRIPFLLFYLLFLISSIHCSFLCKIACHQKGQYNRLYACNHHSITFGMQQGKRSQLKCNVEPILQRTVHSIFFQRRNADIKGTLGNVIQDE